MQHKLNAIIEELAKTLHEVKRKKRKKRRKKSTPGSMLYYMGYSVSGDGGGDGDGGSA